jgi:hypothetical protein
MSVSSEVQRTLVKSPPELWAELSDPSTLARHLGELGEIRIVRTEPDRAVDWEAAADDGAQVSGRVEIEASGWGTRVTLSASRSGAMPEPAAPELTLPDPAASEPEIPEPEAMEPEPKAMEPQSTIVAPAPRPGFFARLFHRRKARQETEPPAAVEIEEPAPEQAVPAAEIAPEPLVEPESDTLVAAESPGAVVERNPEEVATEGPACEEPAPEPDISAELAELEQQTTAVLTGVLDRLGAAHHRPFSRA